ncbi:MAG: WG repeat-containing protein [Candidatus Riflebacteria bacterium]|nr:WG repeat-containing protein [Candidatus Riflebacteria bacterium]
MNKILPGVFITVFLLTAAGSGFGQQTHITFADRRAYFKFEGIDNWEFKPVQVGYRFGFDLGTASGAWGYFKPSGEYEIDPLFEKVCRFMHGYAPVKEDGKWGIINTEAEYVVKPAFDRVWSPPKTGEGVYGITMRFYGDGIDPDDLYEADPLDDWTNGFNPGVFALKKNNRWYLIDDNARQIGKKGYENMLPMSCERAAVFADGHWGFIDRNGKLVIPMRYYSADSFSEDLAAVCQNNLWGYINRSGNDVIRKQFDLAEQFASGKAIVTKNEKTGIIDTTGKYLLKPEYDSITRLPDPCLFKVCKDWSFGIFSTTQGMILPIEFFNFTFPADGIIVAWKDSMQGMFDANGKVLLPIASAAISAIGEDYLLIAGEDSLTLYDLREEEFIPTSYKSINSFHNELAAFQTSDGKWGFLDPELTEAIPARYCWVTDFSLYKAAVEDETGVSIINKHGQPAAEPRVSKTPFYQRPDWQMVCFNERYGVQDSQGVWLLRPAYENISVFPTGAMLLKSGKHWILRSAEGTLVENQTFENAGNVSENLCWVRVNGKCGYIDETGHMVIPAQFEKAGDMWNNMAPVKKDGLWGFIDAQGKLLLPHTFTDLRMEPHGNYVVYEGSHTGFVKADGSFIPVEAETLPAEHLQQTEKGATHK